jgi:hypothetical protein
MTYATPQPSSGLPPEPSGPFGPPPVPGVGGLAIAAIIVGGVAFLFGLIPFFGGILAIVGLVLSVLAARHPVGRGLGIGGAILSAVALVANILVIVGLVFWGATVEQESLSEEPTVAPVIEAQVIDTPCYSFNGPGSYILNQSDETTANCTTKLELWGEFDDAGTFTNTGVGTIWGTVTVEPIRVATSDTWSDGTLDGTMDHLNEQFIPALGDVISDERVELGGEEANLTIVDSLIEKTTYKGALVAYAPEPSETANGDVQLYVISFTTVEDDGEEILDALLDSWQWK